MKNKILVVDDNFVIRKKISLVLERKGLQVITADNGEHAILKAGNETPDVILLDVMMPELDGFETLERLKASEKTKNIPVIMMTVLGEKENVVDAAQAGAKDYIVKPVSEQVLLDKLGKFVKIPEPAPVKKVVKKIEDASAPAGTVTEDNKENKQAAPASAAAPPKQSLSLKEQKEKLKQEKGKMI